MCVCVCTCGGGAVVPDAGGEGCVSAAVSLRVDGGHGGGPLCGGRLLARAGGLGLPPVGPPTALGRFTPTCGGGGAATTAVSISVVSHAISLTQFHFFCDLEILIR